MCTTVVYSQHTHLLAYNIRINVPSYVDNAASTHLISHIPIHTMRLEGHSSCITKWMGVLRSHSDLHSIIITVSHPHGQASINIVLVDRAVRSHSDFHSTIVSNAG